MADRTDEDAAGDDEAFFEEIDDGCGCAEIRESMTERRRRREWAIAGHDAPSQGTTVTSPVDVA